jgi:hypothetical protein
MAVGSEYAEDLKRELLTEMADNFFSRRRRLDDRLEAFVVLRERVAHRGELALALWRAFRELLLAGDVADAFLAGLGFDVAVLAALPVKAAVAGRIRRPLALTGAGRYRKAVLRLYEKLRQELADYNEGGYAPDPRDPRRMGRIPGHDQLLSVARDLNTEIEAVNTTQSPTALLQYCKGLDPVRLEQESTCGCLAGGEPCCLNQDLAFRSIDLAGLGAPYLPTPPPPEAMEETLTELAGRLYAADPGAALAALAAQTR